MSRNILVRNNVNIYGQGIKTLLFAHGFGCDQNVWRFVAPAFERDYRVVLFDYVGAGKSDLSAYDPQRYSDLCGYAQDILDICAALQLTDVIFIGHSVSSMIGVLASLEKPGVFERLILIGPSPCYINHPPDYLGGFERADIEELFDMMERNYMGWAHFLAPTIMLNPQKPELAQELEASFCATEPSIARRFAQAAFFSDNRSDLPRVMVPSLVMQCRKDFIAPLEVGHYVRKNLAQSQLQILDATGHCPHMSHPQETIATIKEYLSSSL